MSSKIEDRVILVLTKDGEPYGYWQYLERESGITAQRWRGVISRKQRPTTDMIEWVCLTWPEFAFWIATGITDVANGHSAPHIAMTFPERLGTSSLQDEDYFKKSIELNRQLFHDAKINLENDKERFQAISKVNFAGAWHTTGMADIAYKLAKTEEYKEVIELAKRREEQRAKQQLYIWGKKKSNQELMVGEDELISSKNLFIDPRTSHQQIHDIYWFPLNREK